MEEEINMEKKDKQEKQVQIKELTQQIEEEMDKKDTKCLLKAINDLVECELEQISNSKLDAKVLDCLYKLIDIHKDIKNEEYWEVKKEAIKMRYNDYKEEEYPEMNYSGYGHDGDYGNYGNYGTYGRRRRRYSGMQDVPAEVLEELRETYGDYSGSRRAYSRGNYGAKEDTMKSLDYMLKSVQEFIKMLSEDASSEEEMKLIKKYIKKMGETM